MARGQTIKCAQSIHSHRADSTGSIWMWPFDCLCVLIGGRTEAEHTITHLSSHPTVKKLHSHIQNTVCSIMSSNIQVFKPLEIIKAFVATVLFMLCLFKCWRCKAFVYRQQQTHLSNFVNVLYLPIYIYIHIVYFALSFPSQATYMAEAVLYQQLERILQMKDPPKICCIKTIVF